MKLLSKPLLMLLLCLTTAASYSQQMTPPKTRIFASFPDRIVLNSEMLKTALTATEGNPVSIKFTEGFIFNGVVMSNEFKYSNLQCVVIRSAEFDNSLFSVSKITNPDNSISYVGRILNNHTLDGYEIKKADTDTYSLQKIESERILQDCNYH